MTPEQLDTNLARIVGYSSDEPWTIPPYRAWQEALRTLAGDKLSVRDQEIFDDHIEGNSRRCAVLLLEKGIASGDELVAIAALCFSGR